MEKSPNQNAEKEVRKSTIERIKGAINEIVDYIGTDVPNFYPNEESMFPSAIETQSATFGIEETRLVETPEGVVPILRISRSTLEDYEHDRRYSHSISYIMKEASRNIIILKGKKPEMLIGTPQGGYRPATQEELDIIIDDLDRALGYSI